MRKITLVLLVLAVLTSCSNDQKTIEKIVEVEKIVTDTITVNTNPVPADLKNFLYDKTKSRYYYSDLENIKTATNGFPASDFAIVSFGDNSTSLNAPYQTGKLPAKALTVQLYKGKSLVFFIPYLITDGMNIATPDDPIINANFYKDQYVYDIIYIGK